MKRYLAIKSLLVYLLLTVASCCKDMEELMKRGYPKQDQIQYVEDRPSMTFANVPLRSSTSTFVNFCLFCGTDFRKKSELT